MSFGFFLRYSRMYVNQDSFRPWYTFESSDDGKIGKSIRLVLFLATLVYMYFMYQNSDVITEIKDIGIQSHDDIVKWGRNYINFNFTATKDNVLTYEAFEDEAEESSETPIPEQPIPESSNTTEPTFNATATE